MRATGLLMILCLLGAILPGCSAKEGDNANSTFTTLGAKAAVTADARDAAPRGNGKEADPLSVPEDLLDPGISVAEKKSPDISKVGSATESVAPSAPLTVPGDTSVGVGSGGDKKYKAPIAPPPAVADAVVGRDPSTAKKPKQMPPPSGILTAGSFDDNVDPLNFTKYVKKMSQRQGLGDLTTKMQGQRVLVIVKDGMGKPVGNARVKLAPNGGAGVEIVTRSDGRAVFMLPFDQLPGDQPLLATVTPPFGGTPVTETIAVGSGRWEITVPTTQAQLPKSLELAIVLDTTGSMGDELRYLIGEMRGISAAISKQFPEVRQRFALVLYRDEGDEYVARPFDFTDSLDVYHKRLSAQNAAGGGDYPEAMHKGLEEVNQLRWRDDPDTARLVFLIADAPPHAQHMNRTLAAANVLRKKGIAIHPIACSGYDDACEFVMRSCAMLTGGRFLFLTDDSGVGNSHAEPSIPYYQVERLEKLMIRTIASELAGQHLPANPADILRTVGRKVN